MKELETDLVVAEARAEARAKAWARARARAAAWDRVERIEAEIAELEQDDE